MRLYKIIPVHQHSCCIVWQVFIDTSLVFDLGVFIRDVYKVFRLCLWRPILPVSVAFISERYQYILCILIKDSTTQFYLRLFISERDMLALNLRVRTGVFVGLHTFLLLADFRGKLSFIPRKLYFWSWGIPTDLTRPPKFERAEPGLSSITEPGLVTINVA